MFGNLEKNCPCDIAPLRIDLLFRNACQKCFISFYETIKKIHQIQGRLYWTNVNDTKSCGKYLIKQMKRMFLKEAIIKLSFFFYVLLCYQVIITKWIIKKTGTVQKFLQDSFKGAEVPESHVSKLKPPFSVGPYFVKNDLSSQIKINKMGNNVDY